jgi:cell division septation protein DedD
MIAVIAALVLVASGTCFGIGYYVGHYALPPVEMKQPIQTASLAPSATALAPQIALGAAKSGLGTEAAQTPTATPTATPAATANTAATQQSKPAAAPAPVPAAKTPAAQVATAKPSPSVKRSPSHSIETAHYSNVARRPDPFAHLITNPNYGVDSSPSHQPMVQVAVLQREEDASVLVDALSRHGYSASADREPDHRIHVRLGPFSSRTDASAMRDKLLNDGYNAVVQ